jgi:hypothetical protein
MTMLLKKELFSPVDPSPKTIVTEDKKKVAKNGRKRKGKRKVVRIRIANMVHGGMTFNCAAREP